MAWKLYNYDLDQIWDCIFPRLLAETWVNKEVDDYVYGTLPHPFDPPSELKKAINHEFDKISPSNFDRKALDSEIIIDVLPGMCFDYVLHDKGVTLPWPPRPQLKEAADDTGLIFDFYLQRLSEQGAANIDLPFAEANVRLESRSGYPYDVCRDRRENLKQIEKRHDPKWLMTGREFQAVMNKIPVTVVSIWRNDERYDEVKDSPETFAKKIRRDVPSIEFPLPEAFEISMNSSGGDGTGRYAGGFGCGDYLSPEGLTLIHRERPKIEDIFEQWAAGQASLPTFSSCGRNSNCYRKGGGGG